MNWIHVLYDKDLWRYLADTVINLLVPYKMATFLTIQVKLRNKDSTTCR